MPFLFIDIKKLFTFSLIISETFEYADRRTYTCRHSLTQLSNREWNEDMHAWDSTEWNESRKKNIPCTVICRLYLFCIQQVNFKQKEERARAREGNDNWKWCANDFYNKRSRLDIISVEKMRKYFSSLSFSGYDTLSTFNLIWDVMLGNFSISPCMDSAILMLVFGIHHASFFCKAYKWWGWSLMDVSTSLSQWFYDVNKGACMGKCLAVIANASCCCEFDTFLGRNMEDILYVKIWWIILQTRNLKHQIS